MKLKEWFEQAKRGTSGDMVMDILFDWKKDQDQKELKKVVTRNGTLRWSHFKTWASTIKEQIGYTSTLVALLEEIADYLKKEENDPS